VRVTRSHRGSAGLAEDGVPAYHRRTAFMKTAAFLILLCVALAPRAASAQAQPVIGAAAGGSQLSAHIVIHALAGLASGLLAAGLVEAAGPPRTFSDFPLLLPGVAVSSATAAGIAKEVLDSTGFGAPRFAEALSAVGGGLLAAAMIGGLEGARIETPVPLLSIGALFAIPVTIALLEEIVWNVHRPRTPLPRR
jgi:hypothetical protein